MKKYIIFTLLLFSTTIAFAQQTDTIRDIDSTSLIPSKSTKNKINNPNEVAIFLDFNAPNTIYKTNCGITVSYGYTFAKPFCLCIGYTFMFVPMKHSMFEKSIFSINELFFAPNLIIPIKNFAIIPNLSLGIGIVHFHINNWEKNLTRFIANPGLKIRYEIKQWQIFLAYNYSYLQWNYNLPANVEKDLGIMMIDIIPFSPILNVHSIKLGIGYRF